MKIKAPSNRPKTQRDINTSTRTRATQRRGTAQRGGGKKAKKQDNTKVFIGVGVGAFFLLFIIIAAAAGGDSGEAPVDKVTSSGKKKQFNLPMNIRRQIFADYVKGENKIEDDAQAKTTADRSKGADIRTEVERLKQSLRIELRQKWQKKYDGVNSSFIKRVINEGIEKNWG